MIKTHCRINLQIAFLVLGMFVPVAVGAEVVLVDAGEARAVVVVPDDPARIASYAAEELVGHINLATGVELKVVEESQVGDAAGGRIHVGATAAAERAGIAAAELPAEVGLLRTVDGTLYVVGRDEPGDALSFSHTASGTLWGVYELLERELGVRWLWPGELGTHVPQRERVEFGAWDERVEPRFVQRHWRVMSRHNDTRWGFSEQGHRAYREAERVFLRRHRMGRSSDTQAQARHRFAGWWRRYGDQNPQWFAMSADGERGLGEGDRRNQAPMCVADPSLHDELIRLWRSRRAESHRAMRVLDLGEANTWARCLCQRCRAWDESSQPEDEAVLEEMSSYVRRAHEPINAGPRYARFWKTIHQRAHEIDPDAIVTAFIYMNYFAAPQEDLELHPNMVLSFVPWTSWWFPRHDGEQRWVLAQWRRWRELGATLRYRPNFTFDGYAMPHVHTRQMAEAFQHYAAHGMTATDFDSLTGQWATQGPMLYVLARLHVRPEAKIDELLQEYFSAFGPAAEAVADYFTFWESYTMDLRDDIYAAKQRHNASRFTSYAKMSHDVFPPSALEEGQKLLARAVAALDEAESQDRVETGGTDLALYRKRVSFLADGLEHARLCVETAARFADEDAEPQQRLAALERLAAFRRSVEHRFIASFNWLCYQETRSWSDLPGFFEDE